MRWLKPLEIPLFQGHADHIAQMIIDTSADFADDFTDQRPKWGMDDGIKIEERLGLTVVDTQGTYTGSSHLNAYDFVLEFDFQRLSKDCLGCSLLLQFQSGDSSEYRLHLYLSPGAVRWTITKVIKESDFKEVLGGATLAGIDPTASHHLRLVAIGDRVWLYLDQAPLAYFQKIAVTGRDIWIGSGNLYGTSGIMVDNLKFWNLDPAP